MTALDVRAQAADLIDNAIDVLHEHGWCQGKLCDDDGRVCMVSAIQAAGSGRSKERMHAWRALRDVAAWPVSSFNDDLHTTYEDVVLTMKQAAASLRKPQP